MAGERASDAAAAAEGPGSGSQPLPAAEAARLRARYLDLWEQTLSAWAEDAPPRPRRGS